MQFSILKAKRRNLARGCAMFLVVAVVSGCSSGAMRFTDGLDGITTASTPQANVGGYGNVSQPYPGDVAAQQPVYTGGGYGSGSVGRSSLPPPSQPAAVAQAPAPAAVPAAPAPAQVAAAPRLDTTTTASVAQQQVPVPSNKPFQTAGQEAQRLADRTAQPVSQPQQVAAVPQPASPAKPAPAVAAAAGAYTVQQGDTLSAISRKTGVSVAALQQANGLADGNIRIGQSLKVPGATATATTAVAAVKTPANVDPVKTASTPPAPQQTASEKVASYTPPKQATKALDQVQDDGAQAPDSTGIGKMRWPVKGRVISGFGGPGGDGIDISVPKGTPVKAAENGVVIYAGDGLKEFGNTVLVRHDNGLVTVYGNASELNVKRGQTVKRGEQIALSGMSGNANAPKLHFEIRKNSAPVDPSTYLE
ncbi:peptidoglycan DD-metalloendopeptidase family protein [Aquamicrobium sp.]|uniref:peptidoglycan DD-metalloendopeptidase family protein n=1 Tax=Aquamicrobium sp. TaxID=1872579 RepID=UPI00258C55AB|nr:peptidoglycan DD-metalloendopeptidase family protein [Aquamicrobium sp.]MCK9550579.1 peptidoglycan DD-metalloendopeptidase family protein [Aquamicrobium sp.]